MQGRNWGARWGGADERQRRAKAKRRVKRGPESGPPQHEPDSLVLHLAARSYKGTWNEFPVENWFVLSRNEAAKLLPAGEVAVGQLAEFREEKTSSLLTRCLPDGFAYPRHTKHRNVEQSLTATLCL